MKQQMMQRVRWNIRQWPLFLFFCLALPLLSSCEDDRWRIHDFLEGTWISNDDLHDVYTLRFNRNGTGLVEERYDGFPEWTDSFDWEVDQDYIYVWYHSDGVRERWLYDTDRRGLLYVDGINGEYEIRFARWR